MIPSVIEEEILVPLKDGAPPPVIVVWTFDPMFTKFLIPKRAVWTFDPALVNI